MKLIEPTFTGTSTVTVRGAVITLPKLALAFTLLGTMSSQLGSADQLPLASVFQLPGMAAIERLMNPPEYGIIFCPAGNRLCNEVQTPDCLA